MMTYIVEMQIEMNFTPPNSLPTKALLHTLWSFFFNLNAILICF